MHASATDIQALYAQYGPVLFARCRSILKNDEDANDAVQETFVKVIRNWDSFRSESSPLTWMYKISTNLCLNRVRNRKGRSEKREQHKELLVGDGSSAPGAGSWETADVIRTLLAQEDEETQQIVVYLYFDEMTREQTAVLVGVSVPTLRKRLNAFLRRARKQLEGSTLPLAAGAVLLLVLMWSLQ